jgi:hypothetical protein
MSEIKSHIVHDEMEDKLHVAHTQDISPIISNNIAQANEADKHAKWGDTARVATIPAVVVMEWMKEGINVMAPTYEDQQKIKKKLNSPEYAYLRTRGGRL